MLKIPVSNPFEQCLSIAYVHGGTVFYQPGDTLGPRVLSDYELVLILDGHARYRANGQTYDTGPGTIILARPGFQEFYQWDAKQRTQHAFLHFKLESPLPHWPGPGAWPVVVRQPETVCAEMLQHVVGLCATHARWPMERPGPGVCCLITALLDALFAERPAAPAALGSARPQPIQRALQWMRQMIEEDAEASPRLAGVAKAAGVTPKHLCRLFQQQVGCGPMTVCRLLRLQVALALLTRSNLTVKQIANRCGFASQFQFSRNFSQTFGRSPTAMRQHVLRGHPPPPAPLPPDLMPRINW